MGLFPIASTVSSMSNSSAAPANATVMCVSRDVRYSVRCWPPNEAHSSRHAIRRSFSSVRFSHSPNSASCFGTVQRHAAARPSCSRGAGGERGPPGR